MPNIHWPTIRELGPRPLEVSNPAPGRLSLVPGFARITSHRRWLPFMADESILADG